MILESARTNTSTPSEEQRHALDESSHFRDIFPTDTMATLSAASALEKGESKISCYTPSTMSRTSSTTAVNSLGTSQNDLVSEKAATKSTRVIRPGDYNPNTPANVVSSVSYFSSGF